MKFKREYWYLISGVILILMIFFYPKYCGTTYGGLIKPGMILHREECVCLGFKFAFISYPCTDCGKYYYCSGIPVGNKCYELVAHETIEREISCG